MEGIATLEHRGWEVVRLASESLQVDVLPGQGGDILAARWLPLDIDLLWTSPWGLRARGAASTAGDSVARFMESYPGGWQTIFPNGGDAVEDGGVELPFHGEACLAEWEWRKVGDAAVELTTRLALLPFRLVKRIAIDEATIDVTETAINEGDWSHEVMWSHHPAFGAPFLAGGCVIETAARTFVVDDVRDTQAGDLAPGSKGPWPSAQSRAGNAADLSLVPAPDERRDRFGYLVDFSRGWAAITNPALRLRVALSWDERVMPYAWYWLEGKATTGYPWFGDAYVLAIEPASSYPGQGITAVREKTQTLLRFEPGEQKTTRIRMEVSSPA